MRNKLIAIALLLVLCAPAHAAEFVKVDKILDHLWNYEFTFKTSALGMASPVGVAEFDCNIPKNPRTGQLLFERPETCFNTEAEARADAQKKADAFEQEKIKNGESSTLIETKRRYYLLRKKVSK